MKSDRLPGSQYSRQKLHAHCVPGLFNIQNLCDFIVAQGTMTWQNDWAGFPERAGKHHIFINCIWTISVVEGGGRFALAFPHELGPSPFFSTWGHQDLSFFSLYTECSPIEFQPGQCVIWSGAPKGHAWALWVVGTWNQRALFRL